MSKRYLGDSVYAENDTYGIQLTTENGFGPSNIIYLEPEVLDALITFDKELQKEATEAREQSAEQSPNG